VELSGSSTIRTKTVGFETGSDACITKAMLTRGHSQPSYRLKADNAGIVIVSTRVQVSRKWVKVCQRCFVLFHLWLHSGHGRFQSSNTSRDASSVHHNHNIYQSLDLTQPDHSSEGQFQSSDKIGDAPSVYYNHIIYHYPNLARPGHPYGRLFQLPAMKKDAHHHNHNIYHYLDSIHLFPSPP